jgi:MoaA/NifB/PqqE/SkfB family radical SAM enzyme
MPNLPDKMAELYQRMNSKPDAIFVQLTTACNATCINCPHSFTYKKNHPQGTMSQEIWDALLEQAIAEDYRGQIGLYLHFEPLAAESLYNRINDVNTKTKAYVVFSTNASLLDENNQQKLLYVRPRVVHINLNSADELQYEQMTGLNYKAVFTNARSFIDKAKGKIHIEINCPVLPGVDTDKLIAMFPDVKVNVEFYANSRGGLLENIDLQRSTSRFNVNNYCCQPKQNFCVLWDGSVIICCMDYMHESKPDFPNIIDVNLFDTYRVKMLNLQRRFESGDYTAYKMCMACKKEMGFTGKTA